MIFDQSEQFRIVIQNIIEMLKVKRILLLDCDIHRSGATKQIVRQLSTKYPNELDLIDLYATFGKMINVE